MNLKRSTNLTNKVTLLEDPETLVKLSGLSKDVLSGLEKNISPVEKNVSESNAYIIKLNKKFPNRIHAGNEIPYTGAEYDNHSEQSQQVLDYYKENISLFLTSHKQKMLEVFATIKNELCLDLSEKLWVGVSILLESLQNTTTREKWSKKHTSIFDTFTSHLQLFKKKILSEHPSNKDQVASAFDTISLKTKDRVSYLHSFVITWSATDVPTTYIWWNTQLAKDRAQDMIEALQILQKQWEFPNINIVYGGYKIYGKTWREGTDRDFQWTFLTPVYVTWIRKMEVNV